MSRETLSRGPDALPGARRGGGARVLRRQQQHQGATPQKAPQRAQKETLKET